MSVWPAAAPRPQPPTWRAGEWPVRAGVISPAQLSLPPAAQCSACRYTPVSRVTIYTRVPIHTRRHDHGPGEAGEHRDRGGGGRHRHLQQQRPLRLRQVGAVLVLSVRGDSGKLGKIGRLSMDSQKKLATDVSVHFHCFGHQMPNPSGRHIFAKFLLLHIDISSYRYPPNPAGLIFLPHKRHCSH